MTIKFLKVKCGDAIFIHFIDPNHIGRNIVIDTGHHQKKIYPVFKKEVDKIFRRSGKIDLLILTHRDDDHIGGIWKLINSKDFNLKNQIERVWLNHSIPIIPISPKISIGKAIDLKEAFQEANKCPTEPVTKHSKPFIFFGIELIILSPDRKSYEKEVRNFQKEETRRKISQGKNDHNISISDIKKRMSSFEEDKSISNRSSIAFLLKYKRKKALFLADSHPSVIINSLKELGYSKEKKMKVDFVKLSHHGSRFNTSIELLSIIDCRKFVFSTNGKNSHNLPDKETIVRIIKNPERKINQKVQILFNQKDDILDNIFKVDEEPFKEYNFEILFPKEKETLRINF